VRSERQVVVLVLDRRREGVVGQRGGELRGLRREEHVLRPARVLDGICLGSPAIDTMIGYGSPPVRGSFSASESSAFAPTMAARSTPRRASSSVNGFPRQAVRSARRFAFLPMELVYSLWTVKRLPVFGCTSLVWNTSAILCTSRGSSFRY
jgi:hypothetical protein